MCYRLIDPGNEWRLNRLWFEQSAMDDLSGDARSARGEQCAVSFLDEVLLHKRALLPYLTRCWQDLFSTRVDVPGYDQTSLSFESSSPEDETSSRYLCKRCVPGVWVKRLPPEGDRYVFAESLNRIHKDPAMRRRQLKWLLKRLKQLELMRLNGTRPLLRKLGAAEGHEQAARWLIDVVSS